MSRVNGFISGLRGLVRRQRLDEDLDEELRGFFDASVEAKIAAGAAPSNARRAAS